MSYIAFAFLFFIPLSFAQTSLEAIEVVAEKDVSRFSFAQSEVIPTHILETAPSALISPLVEKVPGLVSTQNGGPGGRVSFFLRGTESRHVVFTLDGMKINDTSNTDRQFDAAFMSSAFLKSVSVHKGPQAVLFGSDAMGGVIQLESRKGDNAPETRLTVNGGSFGTIDSSLSNDWQTKNKSNQGTLTVTRFHSDGISRLNKKRFNAKEKDATDISQITSSSRHRWANKVETDILGSYVHGKNELDAFSSDNSTDHSVNDQYLAQQKTNVALSKSHSVSLRNALNRHSRFIRSLSSGGQSFDGNLIQNEFLHRLESEHFGLISGVSTEHEENVSQNIDRSFDLSSVFTQGNLKRGDFKFHAGTRADKHSRYGSFFTGASGIAYKEFSLQYSQGFKAPSLYQLYAPPSFGSTIGNPNLVPETNHSWEAAWKKVSDNFETGVTFFQNRLSNLITFSNAGYLNQGRFIAEGVELSGKFKQKSYEFQGGYTHQNFRKEETTVLRRPYNITQVGASYFPKDNLELNITERFFSSRKDLDENGDGVKLNGYEVMDLGVKLTLDRDDFGIQLKNVLDREYEETYGYSVLPRSVFAHYGHRF